MSQSVKCLSHGIRIWIQFLEPTLKKKTARCILITPALRMWGGAKTGRSQDSLASQPKSNPRAPTQWEVPAKDKVESSWGETSQADLWPPHTQACTHKRMHINKHCHSAWWTITQCLHGRTGIDLEQELWNLVFSIATGSYIFFSETWHFRNYLFFKFSFPFFLFFLLSR